MHENDAEHSVPLETDQGPLFVKKCKCGGVHICLGGISINLGKEAAFFLSRKLGETCLQIQREAEGLVKPVAASYSGPH